LPSMTMGVEEIVAMRDLRVDVSERGRVDYM
jgi:hypothetical protein